MKSSDCFRKSRKKEKQTHIKQNVTWYALVPAILTPVCLMFPYGYCVGTINSAADPIRQFYNQSYIDRYGATMSMATSNFYWALTASIYPLGGVVGAPLVRPLVAKFGRRKTLIFVQIISLIATILMSISAVVGVFELIIIGRGIIGIYSAIVTGVGPMYVSEISTFRMRGPVGSLFSLSISVGILLGNVFGLQQVLGTAHGWPYLLAITGLPALVYFFYSPLLPESPRALYLDDCKHDEARRVLQRLRGTPDVDEELQSFERQSSEAHAVKPMSIKQALTTKRVRWQVASAIILMMAIQLSGINGIHFNLGRVFILAGIAEDKVVYVSIGVVASQLVVTFGGGMLTRKFGRKSLLLSGHGIIIISMVAYTFSVAFLASVPWFAYLSVVTAIGIIFGFCVGLGPIIFTMVPELQDQACRPAAMTLGVLALWISFALVGFATPYLFEYLDYLVFLPFIISMVLISLFVYFVVPETKNKSVLEIQQIFAKGIMKHRIALKQRNHSRTAEACFLDGDKKCEEVL